MSGPLVVNTNDGTCWTRRAVTRGGEALYALADVEDCPDLVMATLAELAEHGIAGAADALPVPVGKGPQSRSVLDRARDALGARMAKDDLRLVLENVIDYAAGLEAERRTTNEALDDAVRALRARARKDPAQALSFAELAQRETNPGRRQAWRMLAQVEESERAFEALTAPTQALEDPHDSPLHRSYRIPHDLPELGGAR
ncbi:hypothetical protein [Streptomyces sp. NBC_01614]|uniref:hypothetical protein n=1 Tax=Streptomyces sp. NBC_01614 TaxID=2975897 RepID=UPI00386BB31A